MKEDKRTKNLTLRDIHVGDWVQVWKHEDKVYGRPMIVSNIDMDGTIGLTEDYEHSFIDCLYIQADIENIDAIPITPELLMGFGFDVSDKSNDRGCLYQDINYKGNYVGQIRYPKNGKAYMRVCGYECVYLHEYISYNYRNNIDIKLEWKGGEP